MASSRRIARETRGRGPQTVGRTTKCTATRARTATRGHGPTALRSQLAPNTWGLWFQGVRAVSLTDDVLTLAVPSSLAADRIRSSYTGMLADTLRDVTGQQLRVELTVETDTRPEEALP